MRCECELSVGAYVLAALEPTEQLRMQEHVQTCPTCAESARQLEGLPRLLADVPAPGEVPAAPVPSELAFQRFRRSASAAAATSGRHRSRRPARWRLAVAAAVLVGGAGLATGIGLSTGGDPPAVVAAETGGISAHASLTPSGSGTEVVLALAGVPPGSRCELVAVSRNGAQESAGQWSVSYSGTFHWTGRVGAAPDELRELVVRTLDGQTLVTLPA